MPEATTYRILINDELKSDQSGLVSFCEAVHAYLNDPGQAGKRLTVMVKRGSEVIGTETVTIAPTA